MTTRQYSSRSQQTTLTGAITSGATSMTVVSGTGLLGGVTIPAGRTFTLVIDVDTALEEIVDATAVSTNTFTIVRGRDGSVAQDHSAGAVVRHMAIGRDYRDANLHAEADASYNDGGGNAHTMHGIAAGEGVVVGTDKTQTLTNKTLTSPIISNPTFTGTPSAEASIIFEGSTADAHETTLTVVDPTQDNTITLPNTTGTVVIANAVQTLTNKTMGDALNAGGFKITNLATPTDASDAVRKDFADAQVAAAATSAASAATSASSAATSASSAATSASSALTSANSASTSAASALTSANSAATSASTMAASVAAAATSATSAAASATAAATSASSASTSASSALTSANSASTSASAASTSATSAAASATAAATSASSASTSASSALTSANSASASATAAATSASSASTSASAAATSATSAAASATAADASAVAAAASAASVDATATTATELRQYAAEDSILPNLPARVPVAEGLLRQAAYWVDATAPTNWGSLGYVYLNGINGNALSVSDETSLDITGDLDLRVKVAMDDWTPGATSILLSKRDGASTQYSWTFYVTTAGLLTLSWSADGSTEVRAAVSSVAPTITDGSTLWVRATLDVDNGASGNDVIFYTSTDGTTWTQLGTTRTAAGTTSIYAGTAPVRIGVQYSGLNSGPTAGKFYRSQILNGINGTTVLDVNIATDYKASNQSTFTAFTGQMVTVNGVDTINNLGWTGDLLPTTLGSSTAADSNDPKFLDWTGTNYVYCPGANANGIRLTNPSNLDITGDIDIRVQVALDDWTPGANGTLLEKRLTSTEISYGFQIRTNGTLAFFWSADGTTTVATNFSTVATGIADGATKWVRVTFDVDNGAGGADTKFFTSDDGTTWTQLGTTVTNGSTATIYAGTGDVNSGAGAVGSTFYAGKFYRAQIFAGLTGTDKRLDVDTSVITSGAATSFFALTGQTAAINRSASGRKTVAVVHPCWLFGIDDYMEVNNRYMSSGTYLYLPGVASNNCTTPDAAALDITGDIDLRVKVAMDDWTPAAIQYLLSKYQTSSQRSYGLTIGTNGRPSIVWSTDGTATGLLGVEATVAPTVADGATLWIRATLDVNNGASGNTTTFYTSTDGTTWTQLGNTVTLAGTTSIFNSTSVLEIGSVLNGTSNPLRGKVFRAQVLNGIDGTVAFDANFETSITSLNQTSFTESSANAATVTINRSGSTYRSAGITTAGYLYPGATNTFSASATSFFDFTANDSFTLLLAYRQWATVSSGTVLMAHGRNSNSVTTAGKRFILRYGASNTAYLILDDGTNVDSQESQVTVTSGALSTLAEAVTTTTLQGFLNGTSVPSSTRNAGNLADGSNSVYSLVISGIGTVYADMELYGAAVFRRALTDAEIASIYTYYAGRVGA